MRLASSSVGATSSSTVGPVLAMALLVALTACGGQSPSAEPSPPDTPPTSTSVAPTPSTPLTTSAAPTPKPAPSATESADPRWRFYTDDHAWHTSPWFEGRHRVMIGYGCNTAPWYSHDSRCPGRQGFHHGIDVAMPCGTPLHSAVDGVVVDPSAPGAPGSAYGVHPFRIRSGDHDILIGHAVDVFVRSGQRVRVGQRIALAGDSGAPDGCHLNVVVRRAGGGLSTAPDPSRWLSLR
jgi:murein DD-endopeptidase MepM/ murein hydrolase activator NlpD